MKKISAAFAAAWITLACCIAVSAGSINIRAGLDQDCAAELAASFGVPEEQVQIISLAQALLEALDVDAAILEDRGQLTLNLNGKEAMSLGVRTDEEGITLLSTLFPNYALSASTETLTQMMEEFAGSMSGSGDGMNFTDMGAMSEIFAGYFTRFSEACAQAAVPGEPLPGEYEINGYLFDTMVPVTVDIQAIQEAAESLMDEMMADEAVLSAIRSAMQDSGAEFIEEEFRAGFEEWIGHFPDEASAEFYTNSEGGENFYLTGKSSYAGKDTPSFEYTMLYDEDSTVMTFNGNEEPNMEMMFAYSNGTMNASCAIDDLYFGCNCQNEGKQRLCELFFMNQEKPLLTITITYDEEAVRTLEMNTESKTILPVEELLSGSGAAGGFIGDFMTNGIATLFTTVTEELPEIGALLGAFGDRAPEEEDGARVSERILQLGTSAYTMEIPADYSEGERTQEEIQDGLVAYLQSPDRLLDFDIYQFSKEGYPEDLAEYTKQEAAEYESAFDVVTDLKMNGIDAASYRARELYDGQEYETLTYILDGGDEFVEVVFWLDGEETENEAQEIISSLSFATR